MKLEETGPDDKNLDDALRALARDEHEHGAPSHVENAVMHAWDSGQRGEISRSRFGAARTFMLAAAASLILAVSFGGWWLRRGVERSAHRSTESAPPSASSWQAYDSVAWLEPDPDSLQVVRIRVASATLIAQGYAVSDPDGDGTVDIEMIVGSDGTARSVRVTSAAMPMY